MRLSLVTLAGLFLASCATPTETADVSQKPGLATFESEADFVAFLASLDDGRESDDGLALYDMAAPPPPPPPAAAYSPAPQAEVAAETIAVTGSRVAPDDAITNTQEEGVDEGGIVKKRGDILVVLRRGRLFTMSIADGALTKLDQIDAYPPGVSGRGDWYDEMLLKDDMVVVVGYSYARGGTEINRFRLGADGSLSFLDASHLRSNDYYSSRNYASRLIGDRLVYYSPLYLNYANPYDSFPAYRRWTGEEEAQFERLLDPAELYYVPGLRDAPNAELSTLHSVTECDLGAPVIDCRARAILGPESRNFYVTADAVYLWRTESYGYGKEEQARGGHLFRMPFDRDQRPRAIGTFGAPVDQFSFREDKAAGILDVLVRDQGGGDWMWNPEVTGGGTALLSLPLSELGDGSERVDLAHYRDLPAVSGWNFQNRFVGDHVLYGAGEFADRRPSILIAAHTRGGAITPLAVPHAVERLDMMGRDGIVIGSGAEGLTFTAVELGNAPTLGSAFTFPDASQGENRSHAYFFRADSADGKDGYLGLPVMKRLEPSAARFLGSGSAVLFLERAAGELDLAGELEADAKGARDDACVASCVDWYGNARPIFAGDRVFALMGYELVEGRFAGDSIRELRRLDFAPATAPRRRSAQN